MTSCGFTHCRKKSVYALIFKLSIKIQVLLVLCKYYYSKNVTFRFNFTIIFIELGQKYLQLTLKGVLALQLHLQVLCSLIID